MDDQDIDTAMVFKQMNKIADLKQQLEKSKQREAKLRECVEFYAHKNDDGTMAYELLQELEGSDDD